MAAREIKLDLETAANSTLAYSISLSRLRYSTGKPPPDDPNLVSCYHLNCPVFLVILYQHLKLDVCNHAGRVNTSITRVFSRSLVHVKDMDRPRIAWFVVPDSPALGPNYRYFYLRFCDVGLGAWRSQWGWRNRTRRRTTNQPLPSESKVGPRFTVRPTKTFTKICPSIRLAHRSKGITILKMPSLKFLKEPRNPS